ncbi:hypothetical protein NQ318_012374 [Aromia moschata]|uniref:Uncharacterized protein n=1 Tax=Aromia moschata TaxID=1265417 RepID=A0AAV8Y343_9CUCU|nr:hypothetical protein NQ318_012374 [Aromia moschata]
MKRKSKVPAENTHVTTISILLAAVITSKSIVSSTVSHRKLCKNFKFHHQTLEFTTLAPLQVLLVVAMCMTSARAVGSKSGWEGGSSKVPVSYNFDYGVDNPQTNDYKSHYERREGDHVVGAYEVMEADGTKRVVKYKAGPGTGFEATVERVGHAAQPAVSSNGGHQVGYGGDKGSYGSGYEGYGGYSGLGGVGGGSYMGTTGWNSPGHDFGGGFGSGYGDFKGMGYGGYGGIGLGHGGYGGSGGYGANDGFAFETNSVTTESTVLEAAVSTCVFTESLEVTIASSDTFETISVDTRESVADVSSFDTSKSDVAMEATEARSIDTSSLQASKTGAESSTSYMTACAMTNASKAYASLANAFKSRSEMTNASMSAIA